MADFDEIGGDASARRQPGNLGVTRHASVEKVAIARQLRRQQTPAEARVWELLRDRRLHGLKFRRQQVLFGFVADFYCAELKLVLELDGEIHATDAAQGYDEARDAVLAAHGIAIIRVANDNATWEELTKKIPSPTRERVVSRRSRRAG